MGSVREQPPRALLRADCGRKEAPGRRASGIRTDDPCRRECRRRVAVRIAPTARIRVTSVAETREKRLALSHATAWIAAILGLLSVSLAGLGVCGVFVYTVEQRIRLALDARPVQIVMLLLATSSRAIVSGLAIGIAGGLASTRIVRSPLYDVSPFDFAAYAVVALVLAAIASAATILPARRALRIDLVSARRAE